MKLAPCLCVIVATSTATSLAGAQAREGERPAYVSPLGAPRDALELSLASGYAQGFGSLQSGVGLPSVATGGLALDLGIGYRIDPTWAVLWGGEYQALSPERTDQAQGFSSSIAAQVHFRPAQRLDPWAEAGAGYRFLWESPTDGPTLRTHGFQLARVRVGLDWRADRHVALGPVVGADVNLFLFQDFGGNASNIPEPRASSFFFAGVQGRIDIGGGSAASRALAARRPGGETF